MSNQPARTDATLKPSPNNSAKAKTAGRLREYWRVHLGIENAPKSRVIHCDGYFVVWVASSRFAEAPYRVEVDEFAKNGTCTCPHFQKKLIKFARRGVPSNNYRCRHIIDARNAWINWWIDKLKKVLAVMQSEPEVEAK